MQKFFHLRNTLDLFFYSSSTNGPSDQIFSLVLFHMRRKSCGRSPTSAVQNPEVSISVERRCFTHRSDLLKQKIVSPISLILWVITERINDLQSVTGKVITWALLCFYLNDFFSSRQGTSNPSSTMFPPQLTIFSKRMLGSSEHESEWHWESSFHNEWGHTEPLGSSAFRNIHLYGKSFLFQSPLAETRQESNSFLTNCNG